MKFCHNIFRKIYRYGSSLSSLKLSISSFPDSRKMIRTHNLPLCGCKFNHFSSNITREINESPVTQQDITSNLVLEFANLLQSCDVETIAGHPITAECINRLPQLNDQQLFRVLSDVGLFHQINFKTLKKYIRYRGPLQTLFQTLDVECCRRYASGWDMIAVLTALESSRCIFNTSVFKFPKKGLRSTCGSAFSSPAPVMLKFVAFMNRKCWWRRLPSFYCVEYALQNYFDELRVEEISMFLRAFVLTPNTYVNNDELLVSIFVKITDHLDGMSSSTMNNFLHFANRQIYIYLYPSLTHHVAKILDFLYSNFDAYPLSCHSNAAALSLKFLLYRPRYLDKICQSTIKESALDEANRSSSSPLASPDEMIRSERSTVQTENSASPVSGEELKHSYAIPPLKSMELENITRTVAFFNCAHLAAQLKPFLEDARVADHFLNRSPKYFVRMVTHLAYVGHHCTHFIDTFLSTPFLRKTYHTLSPHAVHRHILRLDAGVQIECADYAGERLESDCRRKFADFQVHYSPRNVYFREHQSFEAVYKMFASEAAAREFVLYERTMKDAASVLGQRFGGEGYTHLCRALPHLPGRNLIWSTDAAGEPQRLPAAVTDAPTVNFDAVNRSQPQRWYMLVCSSRNLYDDTAEGRAQAAMVVGHEVPKVRQMQLLGFRVVVVVHEEWETMSDAQKLDVLEKQIVLEK